MTFLPPTEFDPYQRWLGIPRDQQPADHYRLLGLPRFDDDTERIEEAAEERMRLVRTQESGPQGLLAQPILEELAAALDCLTSADSKRAYDERLRQKSAAAPMARVVPLPRDEIVAPPVMPPPLAAGPARMPIAEASGEAGEEDLQRATLGSVVRKALLMAMAVLLIAAATFGIGRFFIQRTDVANLLPGKSSSGDRMSNELKPAPEPVPSARDTQGGREAVVVMQEGSRDVNFTPLTADLAGSVQLKPIGGEEVLDQWCEPGDQAAWKFKLLRPGFFQLEVTYAALDEAGETKMTAYLNDEKLQTSLLTPTGALDKWATRRHTVAVIASGQHDFTLRLDDPVDRGCLVVKRVRLTPAAGEESERNGTAQEPD